MRFKLLIRYAHQLVKYRRVEQPKDFDGCWLSGETKMYINAETLTITVFELLTPNMYSLTNKIDGLLNKN